MRIIISVLGFIIFLTAMPAFSQTTEKSAPVKKSDSAEQKTTDEQKKRELYSRWQKLEKDEPAEAAQTAAEYAAAFPDDESKNALTLKKWLADYEKTAKGATPAVQDEKSKTMTEPPTKAAVEPINAAGTWTIVVTTQQGDLQFTLVLEQSDKNLSGTAQSPYGNGTVTGGGIEGVSINLDVQSDPLEVKLKGTIDGDKMKGTVKANNASIPELPFVGTRSK